jgi:GTP pyrophosphokinase
MTGAQLGEAFDRALVRASELHHGHTRKGTAIPYVGHLLGVAALVLEDGGDEDEAIAALLHDAVEDRGGQPTLDLIRHEFGRHVAETVAGCSDTTEVPKPPWRERKTAYIAHLDEASPSVVRVSLADKLHNARAINRDLRVLGEELWERFDPDSDQLWYYRSLAVAFHRLSKSPMVAELVEAVAEMETLAIMSAPQRDDIP